MFENLDMRHVLIIERQSIESTLNPGKVERINLVSSVRNTIDQLRISDSILTPEYNLFNNGFELI